MDTLHQTLVTKISKRFGIQRMLSEKSYDNTFIISLLYYFGILTISGESSAGKICLNVPNMVIRGMFIERIYEMLLPEPTDRDAGRSAAEKVYQKGDLQEICDFVERRYFNVFHNRDYRWANELTIKTAFLTLLYNDILFFMDSEKEINRRFVDLTMIIRPDMRRFQIFDILIEFKFVNLASVNLNGKEAKELSKKELENLPAMRSAMNAGVKQVSEYSETLKARHPELHLKKFAVVSLGFERICFQSVEQ